VTISITFTTAQRDAVREEVESICHLGTDLRVYLRDAASDPSSARWIADWTQQVAVGARLLERLGWQEHGEDRSYELDVDQDVAEFMQRVCERTLGTLQDDCRDLGTPFAWTGPEADEIHDPAPQPDRPRLGAGEQLSKTEQVADHIRRFELGIRRNLGADQYALDETVDDAVMRTQRGAAP
jgi:hypothetical protein